MMTDTLYHGTRTALTSGDLIHPGRAAAPGTPLHVYLTSILDEAIWDAEIAPGDNPGRVYIVSPTGPVEPRTDLKRPGPPSMSLRSLEPLRVSGEVTEWLLYHGTRADLKAGDLIKPGHVPNFGDRTRTQPWVYFARTLDAAMWGAELAEGDAPGRIYVVEPTGPVEDDPNLTDKKFRGNPTKSFRSRAPVRVTGEVANWKGHSPEALTAMKAGLERLKGRGAEIID